MRMQDVATRLRADVEALEFPWGSPLFPKSRKKDSNGILQHGGCCSRRDVNRVRNPVGEIGAILRGGDAIYLVDAVTSLGGIRVSMDEWNCDVLYSGTQKCLSCPPDFPPFPFPTRHWRK